MVRGWVTVVSPSVVHIICVRKAAVVITHVNGEIAGEPFPGYFGVFYNVNRPTKNANEAKINAAAQEKLKGLKPWEILKKNFDRMK